MSNFYYSIPNKVIADFFIEKKERDLLSIGANIENIETMTVLEHILLKTNSMKEVIYATQHGIDINVKNVEGKSLIDICKSNYLRSKILRQHGALSDE